ncbi:SatD family protein [Roseibium sediminis]|uniref:SatD family protein n=1 Tax=Roseibium sediminis TaxID=1775174 RepID=UPI00123CCBD3|nr:SatD family protein [Roseibium sediminis]
MGQVPRNHTVLMGDIVESEQFPSREHLHVVFNRSVDAANQKHGDDIASPLTITLGDEFQGLFSSRAAAFRVAHEMRLELLHEGVRCRFVVGDVHLETPLNKSSAWNMLGRGLAEARGRLEEKQDPNAYRFSFPEDGDLPPLLDAIGSSLSFLEEGWTERQQLYIRESLLSGLDVVEIADRHGVSKRAVYKGLEAANLKLYQRQLDAISGYLRAHESAGR